MNQKRINQFSRWSMGLSLLCAIHCAAMPLFIAAISFYGVQFISNPLWEAIVLILSMVLAFWALFSSFGQHKKYLPLSLFAVAFLCILLGLLVHWHPLLIFGSIISAISLFFNWRYSRAGQVCLK